MHRRRFSSNNEREDSKLILYSDGDEYIWHYRDDVDDSSSDDSEDGDNDNTVVVDHCRASSIGCVEEEEWKMKLWTEMPTPLDEEEDMSDNELDSNNSNIGLDYNESEDIEFNLDDLSLDNNNNESNVEFVKIVSDMVSSGHSEGHPADSLLMEIKGLKFAQNKTYCNCVCGIVPAMLQVVINSCNNNNNTFLSQLKELCQEGSWGYILVKTMIQNTTEEVEVIKAIEDVVLKEEHKTTYYPLFRFILQVFYDSEILTEEGIVEWIHLREKMEENNNDNGVTTARIGLFKDPKVQEFVEWIQEDDDDEEESDESD